MIHSRIRLVVLVALAVAGSAHGQAEWRYEAHEIVTGDVQRQTVVTGFFLGGTTADLAVVRIDERGDRRLRIYAFRGGAWVPTLDAELRPETRFVDVAEIGGRDRLLTYDSAGALHWFDPESGTERVLVAVACSFDPPRSDEIPHVDVTRDVNGDERDDLVVPGADGFRVFIQTRDGAFADPVRIGPPPDLGGIYGADGYRYDPWSQSRVYEVDHDRDGRNDLVFWNADHFEVHHQDERGRFAPLAESFTTDVAFDSDRLAALATGAMTGKVLHSLADLNGDGVADLVVFSLEGRSISSKRSAYEVHPGAPAPDGGTVFARDVGITFRSEGRIQLGMERHDFDRDGQIDLMFTTIDRDALEGSLWKKLKGFMGDDVWLELEFYRMRQGRYRAAPDATRRIALDGVPSHREPGWVPLEVVLRGAKHASGRTQNIWPRAFNSTLRIGDVTGDARADLLIGHHPRELELFVGVPGPDLFAPRPQMLPVAVPNDEEYVWLVDLDRDGRQEILLHHPFTLRNAHGAPRNPPGTEPHRITLLIARP